jgi:hypothetical protein
MQIPEHPFSLASSRAQPTIQPVRQTGFMALGDCQNCSRVVDWANIWTVNLNKISLLRRKGIFSPHEHVY